MTRAAIAFALKTVSVLIAASALCLANEARAQTFYPAFCKIWNGIQGFSEDSNPLTAAMPFFRANCSNVSGASCIPDTNELPPAHFSCIAPNCDGNGSQLGTWSTGGPSFPPQQPIPGAVCGIVAQPGMGNPNKNNGDPPCPNCPNSKGNPVNFANGNKFQREVDYAKTGDSLEFYRFYNSQGFFNYVPLGLGWTHTWNRYIVSGVATSEADAYRPDGKTYRFRLSGSQWVGDADNPEILVQTPDGGWKLTLRTDEVEVYDHLGRLQSVTSREGRTTTLAYSDGTATPPGGGTYENTTTPMTGGLLLRVTDFQGRTLQFRYSDSLSMSAMVDPTGAVYRYTFNVFDPSIQSENLASVQYPDATTRTYQYAEDGLIFNPSNGAVYSPVPQKLYWMLPGLPTTEFALRRTRTGTPVWRDRRSTRAAWKSTRFLATLKVRPPIRILWVRYGTPRIPPSWKSFRPIPSRGIAPDVVARAPRPSHTTPIAIPRARLGFPRFLGQSS